MQVLIVYRALLTLLYKCKINERNFLIRMLALQMYYHCIVLVLLSASSHKSTYDFAKFRAIFAIKVSNINFTISQALKLKSVQLKIPK